MTVSALPSAVKLAALLAGIAIPALAFGRVAVAVSLALALLALVSVAARRRYWRMVMDQLRGPVGIMVVVTLILWLPSMAVSPLPLRSLEAWARLPVFVGLAAVIWAEFSADGRGLDLALRALLVAAALGTAFAIVALTVLPTEYLAFVRLKGLNPLAVRAQDVFREFATTGMLLIPVLAWAGWRLGGRWRALAAATIVGLLAVIWMTYNRSAIAGLLAMAVFGAGLIAYVRRNLAVNVALLVVVLSAAAAVLLWLHGTRGHLQAPDGSVDIVPIWLIDYQRQTIWAQTINMAMNAPWIGNGINVINLLPGADARLITNNLNVIPAHPHNWLLEVFAETGVIGAAALLGLALLVCCRAACDYVRDRDRAAFAALMVSVGYWVSGLLNVSFWSAWWQISYLVLMAICLAGRGPGRGQGAIDGA